MKLRVGITIVAVILYVGLFNLYVYELLKWDVYTGKLFYNYLTLGAVLFAFLDITFGFVNVYHKQFWQVLFMCIIINYVFIILTITEVFTRKHPQLMFYSFDVPIFAFMVTIFYNEIKYKIMSD